MVPDDRDRRVRRAERLAAESDVAAPLLTFYARVLKWQATLYDRLCSATRPSGTLERDLALISPAVPALLSSVEADGPPLLAAEAAQLLRGSSGLESALLAWWCAPSDRDFFPKAILQPYAEALASARTPPDGRVPTTARNRCPFCGGRPQVSILSVASSADGGGRQLLCATCFTVWPYRRVLCAHCGEEDEHKLGYFHSPAFEHLRVDTCETCRHYMKTVDLTRLGIAVPLVDEVAGSSLDVWARERGYEKIQLNLVGL